MSKAAEEKIFQTDTTDQRTEVDAEKLDKTREKVTTTGSVLNPEPDLEEDHYINELSQAVWKNTTVFSEISANQKIANVTSDFLEEPFQKSELTAVQTMFDPIKEAPKLLEYQKQIFALLKENNPNDQKALEKVVTLMMSLINQNDLLQVHFAIAKFEVNLDSSQLSLNELKLWYGLETIAKIALITTFVPIILLPLEMWQTRLHMGTTIDTKELVTLFFSAQTVKVIMKNLGHSQKVCMGNSINAQKDAFSHQGKQKKERTNTLNTMKYSAWYALFDLVATSYFINRSTFSTAFSTEPILTSFFSKLRFALQGVGTRYARNFFIAFGCIGLTPLVEQTINAVFTREKHPNASLILPGLIGGLAIGPLANTFDIIYRNQIKRMNSELRAPFAYTVLRNLLKENGYKGLRKGLPGTCAQMMISYLMIQIITEFVDKNSASLMQRFKSERYFKQLRAKTFLKNHPHKPSFFVTLKHRYEKSSEELNAETKIDREEHCRLNQ
ncbi:MAG: hypothetical protein H2069_06645 [Legionella sp.]|nr:hypothetical protein [Legionella sp.]